MVRRVHWTDSGAKQTQILTPGKTGSKDHGQRNTGVFPWAERGLLGNKLQRGVYTVGDSLSTPSARLSQEHKLGG